MRQDSPFPLADDYIPIDEESFELHPDSSPPRLSGETPMTMPQRMYAMEQRQLAQSKALKSLGTKMDQVLKILSWKNSAKTTLKAALPLVVTAAAAQFPQAKVFLQGLLEIISVAQ